MIIQIFFQVQNTTKKSFCKFFETGFHFSTPMNVEGTIKTFLICNNKDSINTYFDIFERFNTFTRLTGKS